jgi:hypothetical protein
MMDPKTPAEPRGARSPISGRFENEARFWREVAEDEAASAPSVSRSANDSGVSEREPERRTGRSSPATGAPNSPTVTAPIPIADPQTPSNAECEFRYQGPEPGTWMVLGDFDHVKELHSDLAAKQALLRVAVGLIVLQRSHLRNHVAGADCTCEPHIDVRAEAFLARPEIRRVP